MVVSVRSSIILVHVLVCAPFRTLLLLYWYREKARSRGFSLNSFYNGGSDVFRVRGELKNMGQTGCLCILLYCIYIISACPLSTRLPLHKTSPKQLLDVSCHGFDTDKVSALLPPIICPCVTPQCSTHVHDTYLMLSSPELCRSHNRPRI